MKCIDFEDIASFDCFIAFSLHCGYRGLCKKKTQTSLYVERDDGSVTLGGVFALCVKLGS